MKLKNSFRLAILLPFKEKYSPNDFGSVSLFVKDINELSKFKKQIKIFAHKTSNFFLGAQVVALKKNIWHIFSGKNAGHTKEFINKIRKNPPDIIEIHNRPKSAIIISKFFTNSKLFLFYHNDPLSFSSNSSVSDRIELINKCEGICFVSLFLKKRFLENIPKSKIIKSKLHVIYNGVKPIKKTHSSKKWKNIVFVGELNNKKGFNYFFEAVHAIITEFKEWRVDIFGKSLNQKMSDKNNKQIKFHGYKNNKFVLNFLTKSSISVVPSVWQEPFGRTLIESINAGTATITSTNGGLKEIAKHFKVLKLREISKKTIYLSIKKLIMSQNDKNYYSNNSVEDSPFTLNKISKKLDSLRTEALR